MSTDQFLYFVAALAWPTVAIVSGIALVNATRIIASVLDDAIRCAERFRQTYIETRLLVAERQSRPPTPPTAADLVATTSASALLALIQTNGGLPSAPGDKIGRQLVREVREMYDEVHRPTPTPPATARQQSTLSSASDDLTLEDLEPDTPDNDDDEPFHEL